MDIKFYLVASLGAILRLIRDELRGFKSPWQDTEIDLSAFRAFLTAIARRRLDR